MSRKIIDTTLRDSFLERIKRRGCPSVKTFAEEMGLPEYSGVNYPMKLE